MGLIFVFTAWSIRKDRAERQRYAQAAAHLDEIDRARAEALQGRFQATSCPICLEAFPTSADGDENSGDNSPTRTIGSDGEPLKLLRCGHCFDESCWAEWVNKGRGQIDKCPICQQFVGPEITNQSQNESNSTSTTRTENETEARGNDTNDNASTNVRDAPTDIVRNDALSPHDRAIQQYRYERNFRLARLAVRYPRFITTRQVQQWTSSTYNGSLVRDPTFVQNDPAVQSARAEAGKASNGTGRGGGGSSGGSSFGGGQSGGGRGGRW